MKPSKIEALVSAIYKAVQSLKAAIKAEFESANALLPESIKQPLADLFAHFESSIVIVGDEQPPIIHTLAHFMNYDLGNVGKTVFYTDPIEANSVDQTQSLRELVDDIDAGRVDTLIMIGGNPAYNTPVDLRLDFNRLEKVKLRAHLSLYNNETSELCHWHIPAAHYLESWADARSYDGTVTIVQPLIAPLYEGKTAHEVLGLFSDNYDRRPYDIVRDYWREWRDRELISAIRPQFPTQP